ncbi:MAG: ABC transporter ATP-binding protein [Chloroflexi bacterium AL-W]|nr:ABC transporter ATP-binding protein [Chloroflexi bacterium AL-N1]NOK69716.1 ABC transporter ATP-binding protein [Chloroflexi bacterium AL-N10]NOK73680.1 ABC transporter ATP-binding protein [Chloroflexi bacterium AL-N5]NOK83886.1 ABC transporter ATP-binding protein [Chloroflexi bacterium AL-W]NOK88011.1 ABC transporter ATP-binding protein [Chloroflexi bacterium AL-N15]
MTIASSRNGHQHEPLVTLENTSKSYSEGGQERIVLEHVNVVFERGEFIVLLGKSGSGKSTLLNLVSGIDVPTNGEVWVDGLALTQLSEHERTLFRREKIGFIFQFFNLVPTLTVGENLLLPLELNGRTAPADRAKAQNLLDQIGLGDRWKTYPDRLSGGEQQRIAIARALVHDPQLVLADEPTGNLDTDTGQLVLTLLDTLTRQAGKTLLMVTHSIDVASMADRVFRIVGGQLLEEAVVGVEG